MKSKIKKHIFGYDIFKENVPFSKVEEGDILLTIDDEFKRNHNWSFIQMNNDYIELIDQSYARLGKGISILFLISPLFFISCYFLIIIFTIGKDDFYFSLFSIFLMFGIFSFPFFIS